MSQIYQLEKKITGHNHNFNKNVHIYNIPLLIISEKDFKFI